MWSPTIRALQTKTDILNQIDNKLHCHAPTPSFTKLLSRCRPLHLPHHYPYHLWHYLNTNLGCGAVTVIWYPPIIWYPGYQIVWWVGTLRYQITRQRTTYAVEWYPLVKWYPRTIQSDCLHYSLKCMSNENVHVACVFFYFSIKLATCVYTVHFRKSIATQCCVKKNLVNYYRHDDISCKNMHDIHVPSCWSVIEKYTRLTQENILSYSNVLLYTREAESSRKYSIATNTASESQRQIHCPNCSDKYAARRFDTWHHRIEQAKFFCYTRATSMPPHGVGQVLFVTCSLHKNKLTREQLEREPKTTNAYTNSWTEWSTHYD